MNSVLINNDQTLATYFDQANRLKELNQLQEAVLAYHQAIDEKPNFSWYHHNLGETLAQLGQVEEAIASYQKACELNPNSAWSYYNLGELLEQQDRISEATEAYRRAVELNPDFYEFQQS
ncbi:MAG: tetratricopeptide repeat protein, partial [Planktothrix sp.]